MTGNTVLLGIDFAHWRLDHAGFHIGIVAAFFAAVILTRSAVKSEIHAAAPLVVDRADAGRLPNSSPANGAPRSVAAALGMQNAAVRTIAGVPLNTVFITGNLVQAWLVRAKSRRSIGSRWLC